MAEIDFIPNTGQVVDYRYDRRLPDGEYEATVLKSELEVCKSEKNPGKPQFRLAVGVRGGPDGGVRIDNRFFTEPCFGRMNAFIGFGYPEVDVTGFKRDGTKFHVEEFAGLKARCRIRNEPDKRNPGFLRPEIKEFMPIVPGEPSRDPSIKWQEVADETIDGDAPVPF